MTFDGFGGYEEKVLDMFRNAVSALLGFPVFGRAGWVLLFR